VIRIGRGVAVLRWRLPSPALVLPAVNREDVLWTYRCPVLHVWVHAVMPAAAVIVAITAATGALCGWSSHTTRRPLSNWTSTNTTATTSRT